MPQPESWSSDWRIIGFLASSSSCRSETGSAATQPRTRHMGAKTRRSRLRRLSERGGSMETPNRIWWARPKKLCAMERPGGGGRSHRPERRAADIAYLKEHGVRLVISTMTTRHNLGDYDAAGLEWVHVPVGAWGGGARELGGVAAP